jgi:ABC-type multidrug transport system ATPase subunit
MIQDTESHKLSLGCQKMLSLAIQAAIKPKVLLLDEALNGLSESNRVIVINWLQDYLNEGGSLVIADHDRIISELRPSILKLD